MRPLHLLLAELAESLPDGAGGEADGVRVEVTRAEIGMPIESRIGSGAALFACAPRGRQATGFDPALGRLRVSFWRGNA
jgi:hypothetical protein